MNKICFNNTCFEFTIYHFLFLLILIIACNFILYLFTSSKNDKLLEGLYNINYNIPDDIYQGQYLTRSTLLTKTPEQYDELNKDYDKFDFTKPRITSKIPHEYQQISNPVGKIHNDLPTPTFIPNAENSPYLMNQNISNVSSPVSPVYERSHAQIAGKYQEEQDRPPAHRQKRVSKTVKKTVPKKIIISSTESEVESGSSSKKKPKRKWRTSSTSKRRASERSKGLTTTFGAPLQSRLERKKYKERRRRKEIEERQKEEKREEEQRRKIEEKRIAEAKDMERRRIEAKKILQKTANDWEKRRRYDKQRKQDEKQRQKQIQKQKQKESDRKNKYKKIEKMNIGIEMQPEIGMGMSMYPTNIPPGPNGLRPLVGEDVNKTNRGIPVDGIQVPNGGLVDYELIKQRDLGVMANPLIPPEKRVERPTIDMTLPLLKNKYIGLPTRGSYDTYQQVGYLTHISDEDKILKLFGRQKWPGSSQYEYYAIKSTAADQYKVPLYDQRKQLFEGDQVTITKMFPGTYKFFEFKNEELI